MNPYKMVMAVANQKGGCAKTTTAVNIAAALAKGSRRQGLPPAKVLLVDLDPQGNCATSFGLEKKKIKKTVYDLLIFFFSKPKDVAQFPWLREKEDQKDRL